MRVFDLVILASVVTGVVMALSSSALPDPSPQAIDALSQRNYELSLLAQEQYAVPMERRPKIRIAELDAPDALADREKNTITIDQVIVVRDLDYALEVLMPHEFAHHVRCHLAGDVGYEPHDILWATISNGLGGPDTDTKWRRR